MKKIAGDIIYGLTRIACGLLLISAVIVGTYEIPSVFALDNIDDYYIRSINNFYVVDDSGVDDAEMLNDFVETLPPIFVKEFRQNWKVVIEDNISVPVDYPSHITIGGYTDWNYKIIRIKKETEPTDLLDTFVHEIGHCFDFEYGSVSYSRSFRDLYSLYKESFSEEHTNSPAGYCTSSAVEFFAVCFKEYVLCPNHLENVAPKAYKFVDDFYKRVQKIKYVYVYDFGAIANTVHRFAPA